MDSYWRCNIPRLPTITARGQLATLDLPDPSGPARSMQQGFGALGEVFQKIQAAADESELRMLTSTGREQLQGALGDATREFADPDEFQTNASERVKSTFNSVVGSAKSGRVKRLLRLNLQDDLIKSEQQIKYGTHEKRLGIAKANSAIFLEDAERRLMNTADNTERTAIEQEIVDHLRNMVGLQAIKPEDAIKSAQKIKENDAYNRAFFAIRGASDPVVALERFQRDNPNLDPNRVRVLVERADAEQGRITAAAEKAAKAEKEDAVLNAAIEATNGRLTLTALDELARRKRFSAEEYNRVKGAMETGGVMNPQVYGQLEMEIREGRLLNYRAILNNRNLDRQAKSQLMGLITARKDHLRAEARTAHFSNTPQYQEAVKEYRAAISAKGPLESFSDKEQRQYIWGLRQLWDRVEKGEDPMAVSREISERARQMKDSGLFAADPVAAPRFGTKQELIDAFKSGRIDRRQFDDDALIFEQIGKQQQRAEQRRQKKEQGNQRGQR